MLPTQPNARPARWHQIGSTLLPRLRAATAALGVVQRYKLAALQQDPSNLPLTASKSALSREHAESSTLHHFSLRATHDAGQRRMMRGANEHASSDSTSTQHLKIVSETPTTFSSLLPFGASPLPAMGLTFLPRPQPSPKKRSRATADIDGEHSCTQKKKRRLRLFLITSRLSPQFSHPATNIVDRGSSKIAVWAKQRSLGRNLLRKAAILNHIRRRALSVKEMEGRQGRVLVEHEREQEELALAELEFNHGSIDTYTRPVTSQHPSVPPAAAVRSGGRFVVSGSPTGSPTSSRSSSPSPSSSPPQEVVEYCSSGYQSPNGADEYALPRAQLPRRDYLPLPPSPLGLSNYDAFDADENIPDPYSHFDDEDEETTTYLFENDDDADHVPFSPSAVTSTSSSTMQTRVSQVLRTPPDAYPFSMLDHAEPVLGDYDEVEEGAGAIWPDNVTQDSIATITASTSPDFDALFATASSKRTDSFASLPNFRPERPTMPASPNFAPTTTASPNFPTSTSYAPSSPNFGPITSPTCTSPNFSAMTAAFAAPAISPTLAPTLTSPNFPALDAPPAHGMQRRMSMPSNQPPGDRTRRNTDIEAERKRQRDLMFMRFRS
jgi:hypothetical protein